MTVTTQKSNKKNTARRNERKKYRGSESHSLSASIRPNRNSEALSRGKLKSFRNHYKITQPDLARLASISIRNLSDLETGKKSLNSANKRHICQIIRLYDALQEIMEPSYVHEWMKMPNETLGGLKPIEVIERGEIDRIWHIIYQVRDGVLS